MLVGLILLGGLALSTFQNQAKWSDSLALWRQAESISADTIRVHINARAAYIVHGDMFAAIDECGWLLDHQFIANLRQVADIRRICFEGAR